MVGSARVERARCDRDCDALRLAARGEGPAVPRERGDGVQRGVISHAAGIGDGPPQCVALPKTACRDGQASPSGTGKSERAASQNRPEVFLRRDRGVRGAVGSGDHQLHRIGERRCGRSGNRARGGRRVVGDEPVGELEGVGDIAA